MAPISEILGKLSGTLRVPVLTPEYEIVLILLDFPGLTAYQLTELSCLSRAGFFNTLDRLKNRGVIVARRNPTDRRSKLYRLSEDMTDLVISRFTEYHSVYDLFVKGDRRDFDFIKKEITSRYRTRTYNFSCEFQVIFFIYLVPRMSHNHLRKLVDSSPTKFAVSLRNLLGQGIVNFTTDKKDSRRKLYDIDDGVRKIIADVHAEIFDWLENILKIFRENVRHPEEIYRLAPAGYRQ